MVAPLHMGKRGMQTGYFTIKYFHTISVGSIVHSPNRQTSGALSQNFVRKEDLVALTKRVSDYSQRGEVDYARKLFEEIAHQDSVCWNVMIRCYIENHRIGDARELFDKMPDKNSVSWNSMIMAYIRARQLHIALKLFMVMPAKDVVTWTSIITGLSQYSQIEDAFRLFKKMPKPNSVTWSSIISGFQQNGLAAETLNLFKEMLIVGVQPTSHSFTSVLTASADLAMLTMSLQLYSQLLKRGFEDNTHIGNAAISMFIKSGSFYNARRVFLDLTQPDLVTWNSIIMGYGQHGHGMEAIMSFHQMQKAFFLPDGISFLGVLHGCSHCGFLEEGERYFNSMEKDHGISPEPGHYACMVDLLARTGFLKQAAQIILEMPFEPTSVFWRTLLNGCRIWGDLELGIYAADQVLKIEPYSSSSYLMVIDIYASAGQWKEVLEMRRWMRECHVKKELGCSWVEINGRIHLFTNRDETHLESDKIYSTLKLLLKDIAGFEMDCSLFLIDFIM